MISDTFLTWIFSLSKDCLHVCACTWDCEGKCIFYLFCKLYVCKLDRRWLNNNWNNNSIVVWRSFLSSEVGKVIFILPVIENVHSCVVHSTVYHGTSAWSNSYMYTKFQTVHENSKHVIFIFLPFLFFSKAGLSDQLSEWVLCVFHNHI